MKIGILGYGEIGQAIHKVYLNTKTQNFQVFIKDLNRDDGLHDIDVLNVSIPYNDSFNFVDAVKGVIESSDAKLTIVHSTVAVGTIRRLKELLPNKKIVHSPCRGVHPNLYEGIKTFPKFVGSLTTEDTTYAAKHLSDIGIKVVECENSETTELAKLLDTSYYGICIAYHGEAMKACEKFGANFEQVMTTYNQTYNQGYTQLGKGNVVRPVLSAPVGGIGGHCVVENAELLLKQFQSPALDFIIQYKRKK
jgi:UDP-N-acetyl-D-mannosaminuronate dehydrogenase